MSTYFIGDVHGCYNNLRTALDLINFDPTIDFLYLTGDLVSRGPNSLEVLRLIKNLNKNAQTVLGNHDLFLLKIYLKKINNTHTKDFHSILQASDSDELMHWLRHQPILYINENKKIIMTHAGIHPHWSLSQAKKNAQEIENILISKYPNLLFHNTNEKLSNIPCVVNIHKLQEIQNNVNSFTKMRYIYSNGQLNMKYKHSPENNIYPEIYPWFNFSKTITPIYSIIFGHWASLKNYTIPNGIYGLDSGCCWGEKLTTLRWEDKKLVYVPCNPPS